MNGRWDEGREALRRVLSVIPDDYAAHLGLSEANERMDRADEAIWHLERALEQRPNDKDLIDALRGLYRTISPRRKSQDSTDRRGGRAPEFAQRELHSGD